MNRQPLEILKEYWGYSSFRPLQEDIIRSVLAGKDTLALMPTGGGKSVCFQVPGLALEGMTIVITPLIALMKDQVRQLAKRGISARAVFSGMSIGEIDAVLESAARGKVRFLYLSPERIGTAMFQARLERMPVTLLAVDEAHCISEWGFDFRPSYRKIHELREKIPEVPCIAVTATATERVRDDIISQLSFSKDYSLFQKSFSRANLSYNAIETSDKAAKLLEVLRKVPGSSLIYIRNRRRCKEIADWLKKKGISAEFYHGGLSTTERTAKQEAWISDKVRVMVATNAFGMGIDKPDVRTVFHVDIPDSPEAYYQEAGRAGRDEQKAYAVILFDQNDVLDLRKRILQSHPDVKTIRKVYQALSNYYGIAVGSHQMESLDFDLQDFHGKFPLSYHEVYHGIRRLEDQGFIRFDDHFYKPSRLMVRVSREQLYDYQLKNPRDEAMIKTMLRLYGGKIFHGFTAVAEHKIAKASNTSQVAKRLEHLHKHELISYSPRKSLPQLTFLTARHSSDSLPLDFKLIKRRKEEALEKAEALINYTLHSFRCRTQMLLEYFSEFTDERCGVCDNCVKARKHKSTSKINTAEAEKLILGKLSDQKSLGMSDLKTFFTGREMLLEESLRRLLESEKVTRDRFGRFLMSDGKS